MFTVGVNVAGASCMGHDLLAPRIPTIEEALTSNLCDGMDIDARVRELKLANPEADANKAASDGQTKLLSFDDELHYVPNPDGKCRNVVPRTIWCNIDIADFTSSPDSKRFEEVKDPELTRRYEIGQRNGSVEDKDRLYCKTVFQRLAGEYTRRYNAAMLRNKSSPYREMCKSEERDWQLAYTLKPEDWRRQEDERIARIVTSPSLEERPDPIADLATAARFGDAGAVEKFLKGGALIGQRDYFGVSAVEWAVIKDHGNIVAGIASDPAFTAADACGALQMTLAYKRPAYREMLAERCLKEPQTTPEQINLVNAIVNAAARDSVEAVRSLLDKGAPFERKFQPPAPEPFSWGPTGPHQPLAIGHADPLGEASRSGNTAVYDYLRERMSNTGAKDQAGQQILKAIYAKLKIHVVSCEYEKHQCPEYMASLKRLLDDKAALTPGNVFDAPPSQWESALLLAVNTKSPEVVRLLAKHGLDVRGDTYKGLPSAILAIQHGNTELLKTLLELGADPNARYHDPSTAAGQAHRIELGMTVDFEQTPLMELTFGNVPVVIGEYLHQISRPKQVGSEMAKLLLDHGAKLDLADTNGMTALHYAARNEDALEVAEVIIKAGADVNTKDKSGRTPYDHATERLRLEMKALLKANGADSK